MLTIPTIAMHLTLYHGGDDRDDEYRSGGGSVMHAGRAR
jgi:hypothetical protein